MKKSRILLFVILFTGLFACDRVTKIIAGIVLPGKGTITYLHNFIRFVYVENTGAFMSLGSGLPRALSLFVFTALPFLLLAFLTVYILKDRNKFKTSVYIGLILILTGGMGNLADRIFADRHVPDFLTIGFGNFRTGILNMADMYVTFGVIILFLFYRSAAPGKKREPLESSQGEDTIADEQKMP